MTGVRWVAVVLALSAARTASAQDSPGFRGAGRDGKLSGFKAPATWPAELKQGWQVEVGQGHSTPALVEGRLYVHARQGEEEVVLCLDAANGKELWRDRLAVPYEPPGAAKEYEKGPFSSPAVSGGRVYAFGISGVLSCLDAKSGKVVWRNDFKDSHPNPAPMWGTGLSPLVADGICVVHVGREKKGTLFALDAADGKPRWKWEGDGPGYASPVLARVGGRTQLITQTEVLAVGLDPADGKLLWKLPYATQYEQNSVTPVIFGDLVILSGYKMGTTALKVDGAEPAKAWDTKDVSMYMSTAVLKGERLFGFSEKRSGQFFCLNAKSGETLWTDEDGKRGENAAVLDAGSAVLALVTPAPRKAAEPSHLLVFEASDKEYVEKARYKVADGPAFAHPVVSGSSIFIKGKTKLTQWTLP